MLNPEYSLKLVWESGVFPLCHHSFENFPPQFDFVCLEEVGPIIPEIFVLDQLSSCQLLQSPPARLNRALTTELWLYHTRLIIQIFFFLNIFLGDFFLFFCVHYSALLHLSPLRFHCANGCWDRTQDQQTRLDLIQILREISALKQEIRSRIHERVI